MEFNKLPDSELAKIMVNYISRVTHLEDIIARYLDKSNHRNVQAEQIKNYYKQLKHELRKDAGYLNLVRNRKGSKLYMYIFSPSIQEASAWGLTAPTNSAINQAMYSAVEEAHHKLTKYYNLEQWRDLM